MLVSSAKVWRLSFLVGSFFAGCVFVVVLFVSKFKQPIKLGEPIKVAYQRKMPFKQARNGTVILSSASNADVVPAVLLPSVNAVLLEAHLSSNWTEDPDLKTVRKFGFVENLPPAEQIYKYNGRQLSAMYHSYLDNSDIRCKRKLRMGQVGNCGWEICDDYEWRPIPPCIIYSFGINYEFSFDDDAGKVYGCDVFSFDPSMSKQPTYQRSDRVMFYRLGLGGKSGEPEKRENGWVLYSLSNLRAMLNHTNKIIDVLKMDIESAEWSSLATMIKEKQLDTVRQLLVEYHQGDDNPDPLRSRLKVIGDIERAGFKKFYITKNPACKREALGFPIKRTTCYEVHYVNSKLRRSPE